MSGGKARRVMVDGRPIDAGPTVFTLRDVFEQVFNACGSTLDDWVATRPAEIVARHAWSEEERLDLYADPQRSEEAIGDLAGADAARGYRSFRAEAQRIYDILDASLLRRSKVHWPLPLMWRIGLWAGRRSDRDPALREPVEGVGRTLRRSAVAPIVRPLCDLLRLVLLSMRPPR